MASDNFDISLAWMRRVHTDLRVFVEGLAVRLESDLPGLVEVERKRDGLFSKTNHVRSLLVRADSDHYYLERDGARVLAVRSRKVRGVVLKREELPLAEWLQSLLQAIDALSGEMQQGSQALRDFLLG